MRGLRPSRALPALQLFLGELLAAKARAACLPTAVPAGERVSLEDPDGSGHVPFGLWTMSWDSARLVTHVVKLLAEEVMGYNSTISGVGSSSASGLYATAGCRLPNDFATDPQCSGNPLFVHHASLEVWGLSKITSMRQRLSAWPEAIPEDAGDIGYEGVEGTYVFTQQRQEAYRAEGLPLEYYRSYDAAWHRPWEYFDNYTAFDPAELRPCNETRFMDSVEMQHYVNATGDLAGVARQPGGGLAARCWFGSWWLAPACRDQPERCVPSLTGSDGWFLYDFMQRAAAFNMPLAVAVGRTNELWRSVSRRTKCLPYWWQPDSSFIDLRPTVLTFPPYNALERARHIRTSMADSSRLSKWMHRRLGLQASRLREFLLRFSLSMDSINDMLLANKLRGSNAHEEVACEWLTRNDHIWNPWIPVKTDCIPGKGLVSEDGSFVPLRANASACAWCPPGMRSARHADHLGTTYICLKCEAGTSQPNPGQLECSACAPGTFADAARSRECRQCAEGEYQNSTASSGCEVCAPPMTTRALGSTNVLDCICPDGFFAPRRPSRSTPCEPCPEGMTCKLGSAEVNIPRLLGAISAGEYPRPLPKYYTAYAEPLLAYVCLEERSCPGGAPGTCGSNATGIACGRCMRGYYQTVNQGCLRCPGLTKTSLPLAMMMFLVCPLLCCLLYKTSQDPLRKWGSPMNAVGAAVFLTLVYLQIIATVRTCYLQYPAVLSGSVEWMSYSLDVFSSLHPECSDFADFKLRFIMRLLMPIHALLIFFGTWLFSRMAEGSNRLYHMDGHTMMGCYGGVYNTFFIGIASQTFSLFQCYEHPNGRYSLRSSPDVLCDSQTWQDLVVAAIIAILVFCGGALTLFSYINLKAPSCFHDEVFRKKWRFLFMRFRPSVWWWGTLLLLKGVWLNLTTVIFTEGHLQLIWLTFAHIAYLLACFALLPWRSLGVAALDVAMHAMSLLFFALLPHFAPRSEASEADAAGLSLACCSAPLLAVLAALAAQLKLLLWPQEPDWQERARILCAALRQASDVEQLSAVLQVLPTADIWTLETAKGISQAELLRESGTSSRRCSMHHATSCSSLGSGQRSSRGQSLRISERRSSERSRLSAASAGDATVITVRDSVSAASEAAEDDGTGSTSSIPRLLLSHLRRSLQGKELEKKGPAQAPTFVNV